MNPRYERYGWDYASHRTTPEREFEWYRRHARETGGPVLELACGTGTLLGPLADTGVRVVGLDLSGRMLELARERVGRLPPGLGARIRLVKGDMTRLEPGEYLTLLADAGFTARLAVGYEDRTDDGEDPTLCFIALPARPPAPA